MEILRAPYNIWSFSRKYQFGIFNSAESEVGVTMPDGWFKTLSPKPLNP